MKTIRIIGTTFLLILISGCLQSVNPLYTQDDLIFDSRLLGDWIFEDEHWSLEKNSAFDYKLTTQGESKKKAVFSVHLVKLGDHTFMDIYPKNELIDNNMYEATVFSVHTFLKIDIATEWVKISWIEGEALEKAIDQTETEIRPVVNQDYQILLTGSTQELQKFIQSNLDQFKKPIEFKKVIKK